MIKNLDIPFMLKLKYGGINEPGLKKYYAYLYQLTLNCLEIYEIVRGV